MGDCCSARKGSVSRVRLSRPADKAGEPVQIVRTRLLRQGIAGVSGDGPSAPVGRPSGRELRAGGVARICGKEQPARSRPSRRATAPIRPSQQRADARSGAPGQLLCREAGVSPLRSWSSSRAGVVGVFPQTTGSALEAALLPDARHHRTARTALRSHRARPARGARRRPRPPRGGPMWRPARRTFALANRGRRSPANRPVAPVPPRPWGSRRAGALSVGRLPGCLVSDHVATTQAPVGGAGAATHPPRLPRPAASAAPGASAARGRAAPAAPRRRGSPRAGRAARAGGCCR